MTAPKKVRMCTILMASATEQYIVGSYVLNWSILMIAVNVFYPYRAP